MGDFVLIKNATGNGQMPLRIASARSVYESASGAIVVCMGRNGEVKRYVHTASTVPEVIGAIQAEYERRAEEYENRRAKEREQR